MRRKWTVFLLVLGVFHSLPVKATEKEGHGGGAVVCRNGAEIWRVELLDLWEGEQLQVHSQESEKDSVEQARARTDWLLQADPGKFADFPRQLQVVLSRKVILPNGARPKFVDDAYPKIEPSNCKIEQLANYQEDGSVLIDAEIFDAMSPTQQAALFVHEAVYKVLRDAEQATDSRKARRITAHLFATAGKDGFLDWYRKTQGELKIDLIDRKIEDYLYGDFFPIEGTAVPAVRLKAVRNGREKCEAWAAQVRSGLQAKSTYVYPSCGEVLAERVGYYDAHWSFHNGFRARVRTRLLALPKGELIEMSDTIRGDFVPGKEEYQGEDGTPPAARDESYFARCEAWKASLRQTFGERLYYLTCGKLETEKYHSSTPSYIDAGGYGWNVHPIFGHLAYSRGMILIVSPGSYRVEPAELAGEAARSAQGTMLAGEREAYAAAAASFDDACAAWKRKVEMENSGRLLFVTCESEGPRSSAIGVNEYLFSARGKYYVR